MIGRCSATRARLRGQHAQALGARGDAVLGCVAKGQQAAPAERGEQALQSQDVLDLRTDQARVSRRQAPARRHEGARQESKLGVAQPARASGGDKNGCLKIEQKDLEILSFLN